MADNKKYYYLKLKENFYDSEQLIILQNMQDGYLYSDILMKLYLRSLKTNGKLMFNNIIPYTPNVLAQVVRHQVGTVEKALKIFKDLGLIEVLDNGAIYMLDIQNFIGKSSTEADRIRNYRTEISNQKEPNCTNVLQMYSRDRDRDRDRDKAKDIDIINAHFEQFWKAYPKKVSKQKCLKWFQSNKPNEQLLKIMLEQLERFKQTKEWQKDNGQFIPYPDTWLRNKRWEDEFETEQESEDAMIKRLEAKYENDSTRN